MLEIIKGIALWASVMLLIICVMILPELINQGADFISFVVDFTCIFISYLWISTYTEDELIKYSGLKWIKNKLFHGKD